MNQGDWMSFDNQQLKSPRVYHLIRDSKYGHKSFSIPLPPLIVFQSVKATVASGEMKKLKC